MWPRGLGPLGHAEPNARRKPPGILLTLGPVASYFSSFKENQDGNRLPDPLRKTWRSRPFVNATKSSNL